MHWDYSHDRQGSVDDIYNIDYTHHFLSQKSRQQDENRGRDRAMLSSTAVTKGWGNHAGSCFGLDYHDRSTTAVPVSCEETWLPALVLHRSTLTALESCAKILHNEPTSSL